jgi:hypothetical protein
MRNGDGDCVPDTCGTDSFEINNVFELMEVVGGVDNRNNIENHGCFCSNLEDHRVHGVMADDIDRICKNNIACKHCNVASGDSYSVKQSGNDFTCDDLSNSDGGQVRCQCDLQTVNNILNNMGGFAQQTCVTRNTPGSGGDFQCCGEGFKQMMYNANKFTCSVDNGEPSVENTSTGAVQNYI